MKVVTMAAARYADQAGPYGSRPVSVDLARHHPLRVVDRDDPGALTSRLPTKDSRDCIDRLAVRHWPRGHRIVVCSLAGGVGRSTIAAAIADLLAQLPYADIWPPALLMETAPRRAVGHTDNGPGPGQEAPTACSNVPTWIGRTHVVRDSGAHTLTLEPTHGPATVAETEAALAACQSRHGPVVLDAPVGLPSDLPWIHGGPSGYCVVLATRPDQASLAEAADALVWMNERRLVPRDKVTVVINNGIEPATRSSLATSTALGIRCHAVHRLARLPLTPPRQRTRERLARIVLDVWASSQSTDTFPTPEDKDPT